MGDAVMGQNAPATGDVLKRISRRLGMKSVSQSFEIMKNLAETRNDGKIIDKFSGMRIFIVPPKFMSHIIYAFIELLGERLGTRIVYEAHIETGKNMVRIGKRAFGLEGIEAFEFYFWLLSSCGWWKIIDFSFDTERLNGYVRMVPLYPAILPQNAKRTIAFHQDAAGEIAGAAEESFNVPFIVKETRCTASGDEFCEFVIRRKNE
ncbi:MAG: V4R domain-containing protein [Candidatus Baldrarchaeia archaeon]